MDDVRRFRENADEFYEKMEYRPVAVAVLYRGEGYEGKNQRRFLVVQSAKDPNEWLFPQGGIERGESERHALTRELREELGIDYNLDVSDTGTFGTNGTILDAEPGRRDKRGFTKGKVYFLSVGRYVGHGRLTLQDEEIADAKWLTFPECVEYFNKGRPEKARLLRDRLDCACVTASIIEREKEGSFSAGRYSDEEWARFGAIHDNQIRELNDPTWGRL